VRRFSPDEIQPFQRGFLGAAVAAGIPWTDDVDDLDGQVGCGSEPMNVVAGVRWNAAFAYLDPVRDHRELTIVADATVERVLIANGRAFGVQARVDGQPRELRADLVVLTAGAYGTPEILLRSGVGPAADLREHGIEFTRSASAAIGRPGGASGGRSCVPRRGSRCCGAGLRRPMALQVVRQPEIAAYLGSPLRFPPDIGDSALDQWIRSTHTHIWHPAGTCRMGPDPAQDAVVDPRGRVHGVRGLRVADASLFQKLPRATPALPTAVIGERIADLILEPRSG